MGKRGASFGSGLKLAGACVSLAWLASVQMAYGQAANPAPTKAMNDLIKNNCLECHNTEDWAGQLALDTMDLRHVGQDPQIWEKAVTKLRGRLMPPAGKKQPSQADVNVLVKYLETSIDSGSKKNVIGHVSLERLSRVEYAASMKELLDVDVDPKLALPTEVEVEGFSNIASALGVSPAFMEQYMSATRKTVGLALGQAVPKMAKVTVPITAAPANSYPLGTRGSGGGGGGFGGGRGAAHFTYIFRPMASTASIFRQRITSTSACIRAARKTRPRWFISLTAWKLRAR